MAYETTSVAVESSQATIRKLLQRHGANEFTFGEMTDGDDVVWAAIGFRSGMHNVRIRVPLKMPDPDTVTKKAQRSRTKSPGEVLNGVLDQEARRIWRVLSWNLKARMEAVEEGVETFEEAFLAHLVNPETNETVYEELSRDQRYGLTTPRYPALTAG